MMKIKRILLIIDSLSSGGAQRQFAGLATTLHQAGYAVKAITYYNLPFYQPLLQEAGVDYEYISGAEKPYRRFWLMNKAIRKFSPDYVISYLDTPSIIACFCKMLQFGKWKLVVSERNTTQRINLHERIKFWFYKKADAIVPNSYSQEKFIKENFPNLSAKVRTITNFTDTDKFCPMVAKKGAKDLKRIICVGRIAPQKNILRFLEAVNLVKENGLMFKIDWYGGAAAPEYRMECDALIEKYQLADYFEFKPSSPNIHSHYQVSDLFCLPSIYEGFPNVLCEAMSCGLPVVCGAVCDNPQIAIDGQNGYLFDPYDVADIAEKLVRILSLPDSCLIEMGHLSRTIALNKFSFEEFTNKYIELIEN